MSVGRWAQRHLLGLLVALGTAELLVWRLGRPALWLDESASMVATQRTWPHLWLLLHGTDAPLVPYYAVLKLLTGLSATIDPAAVHHPEVLLRWPSVLAMTLAGWVLTVWLARRAGTATALATAAMLLLTGGVSRYGQEARPYALVVLAAVVSTVVWSRLMEDPRPRWVVGYAVSVVLLATANPLAASLAVAHLVAAIATADPRPGAALGWPVLDTLLGSCAGLLVALPLAVMMAAHGGGAGGYPSLTLGHLGQAFTGLFTSGPGPWPVSAVLLLALLGAVRAGWAGPVDARLGSGPFVARTALAWAIVPPLVLLPAVAAQPNLLIGRYVMFVVPGWAVLAGLGVVTVGETIAAALARSARLDPDRAVVAGAAGLAGACLVVAGVAAAQAPTLLAVRTASGHGEDIRPLLALATHGPAARLPIVVASHLGSIELPAYGPALAASDQESRTTTTEQRLESRMVGLHAQWDQPVIWPDLDPYPVRKQLLRTDTTVIFLIRATSAKTCPDAPGLALSARIARCLPSPLPQLGFRVVAVSQAGAVDGRGWLFALLTRTGTAPGRIGGPPAAPGVREQQGTIRYENGTVRSAPPSLR